MIAINNWGGPPRMIGALVPYVSKIRRSYESNDLLDRMNYQYTAMLTAIMAITLASAQYVGKPIQCWVPAQFTGAWEKYAETFCFMKGSYFLPDDENPEGYFMSEEKKDITYYQWVPLVLALQAFMFYLPCLIWKAFNTSSGINVTEVLENSAKIKKNIASKDRQAQVASAANHFKEALELQKELKQSAPWLSKIRKSGVFLVMLYCFTKLLYVVNILLQYVIFNAFLGTDSSFWGWNILSDLINGRSWKETGHFPRVTLCGFNVRVLGAVHRWSVQCVLMINMYTEKFYVFLWFWYLILGVCTLMGLCYWLVALFVKQYQIEFVSKYLRCARIINSKPSKEEEKRVAKFVNIFLTADGVFLLRLIQTNGGDLLAGDLTVELYKRFGQQYETKADESFDSPNTTATLPR